MPSIAVALNLFASRMEEQRSALLQRLHALLAATGPAIGALAAYAEAHVYMAGVEAAAQQVRAKQRHCEAREMNGTHSACHGKSSSDSSLVGCFLGLLQAHGRAAEAQGQLEAAARQEAEAARDAVEANRQARHRAFWHRRPRTDVLGNPSSCQHTCCVLCRLCCLHHVQHGFFGSSACTGPPCIRLVMKRQPQS